MDDDQHHHSRDEMGHGEMGILGDEMQEPGVMMLKQPTVERWPQYPIIILGLWLIASPFTFGISVESA